MKRVNFEPVIRRLQAAIGEPLELERWSPGDGWTRYRLSCAGGSAHVGSYMRRSEFDSALFLAAQLFDIAEKNRKGTK